MKYGVRIAVLCCVVAAPLWAAESEDAARIRELDALCEQARESKLRDVQEEKIQECMAAPPKERADKMTRADCERYWSDYGWGGMTGKGKRNHSLFDDLPECQAAFKARQGAR